MASRKLGLSYSKATPKNEPSVEWKSSGVSDMSSWKFSASLRTAATALVIGLLVLEAGTLGQAEEKRYGPGVTDARLDRQHGPL
jgi:hypothetical protein